MSQLHQGHLTPAQAKTPWTSVSVPVVLLGMLAPVCTHCTAVQK